MDGIDLEEDSVDFAPEEAETAEVTEKVTDFIEKSTRFIGGRPGARFELRRLDKVHYARVRVGDGARVFRLDWLRNDNET